MKAVVNKSLPVTTFLNVGVHHVGPLGPAKHDGSATLQPTHIIVSDEHLSALQALDVADHRRVALSCMTIVDMVPTPGDLGFTLESQAALKAALAGQHTGWVQP